MVKDVVDQIDDLAPEDGSPLKRLRVGLSSAVSAYESELFLKPATGAHGGMASSSAPEILRHLGEK